MTKHEAFEYALQCSIDFEEPNADDLVDFMVGQLGYPLTPNETEHYRDLFETFGFTDA